MKQWLHILLIIVITGCSQSLTDEEQARQALLLCTDHENKSISLCEDSLILPALQYYRQQGDTANIITATRFAAYYHYENKRTTEAKQLLNEGLKLAQARKDKEQMVEFYQNLAEVTHHHKTKADVDMMLGYLRPCIDLRQHPEDYFYYGMFLAMDSRDSAEYFINKGIIMAYERKDKKTGRFLSDYASYLTREQRYDDALQILNRTDSVELKYYERHQTYLNKARIYILQSQLNKAKECLQELTRLPGEKNMICENSRLQLQNLINFTENRDIDMTSLGRYNDSVFMSILQKNSSLLAKTEMKHKLTQENMSLKIKHQRLTIAFICLFTTIIGVLLYLDNRRKRAIIRLQQQLEQNRLELMQAQSLLAETETPSPDNIRQIHELRVQKISLCKEAFAHTLWSKRLATINCQTATTELTGKESNELSETLTRCFADVMIDLKQESPKLNSEELLYCIFLLMECSNHTISLCTFTAEGTIRTRKTRMKEKLSDNYLTILFQMPLSATA